MAVRVNKKKPPDLSAGQDIRIGVTACDELAEDDAQAEDVRLLVVVLAPQALGGHPVGRPHLSGHQSINN